MQDNPLVSIITVTYNSDKYINDTIESILNQTYNNIEYIIVDGLSTDNTLDIINSYKHKFNGRMKLISEKDKGIYDAMNKGILKAEGEIIGILNSDDFYVSNFVIEKVVNTFLNNNIDSVYSDLEYVDPINTDKIIRKWKAGKYIKGKYILGWHPPHPTFFVKKEIYDTYGAFDLNFEIASDYEIMLRFLEKYNISTYYIPEILIKMRMGGKSNANLQNIFKANLESLKALKKNRLKGSFITIICKLFRKLLQYLI